MDKSFLTKTINQKILDKQIINHINFSINNTIYRIGDEIRLIEKDPDTSALKIVNFQQTPFLKKLEEKIFRENRVKTFAEIKSRLPLKKANAVVKSLINDQLLNVNLPTSLPANELLDELILRFTPVCNTTKEAKKPAAPFYSMRSELKAIDQDIAFSSGKYENLMRLLKQEDKEHPVNKLFQVDYTYTDFSGGIKLSVQNNLRKAIKILSAISTAPNQNVNLENFKRRFLKKYAGKEVPLLIALDPELGINYLQLSSFDTFIQNELGMKCAVKKNKIQQDFKNYHFFSDKYEQAISRNEIVLVLTDDELNQLQYQKINLPVTTSVFFRLFGDDQYQIEHIGGSSGMNLFTRFTDFSEPLHALAKQIARMEKTQANGLIVAEVIHEPNIRSGNICAHRTFREFEIPYQTNGSLPETSQIWLSDILIVVINDTIVLRSKTLNKFIKPMISHALNYKKSSPLYQFLGDLQFQSATTLQFDLKEMLPGKSFYPRVIYKNLVFSPACWNLNHQDFKACSNLDEVRQQLADKNITRTFLIAEGDNELLIDQNREELLKIFLNILKKNGVLLAKEFLYNEIEPLIVDEKQKQLNNQLISIIHNKQFICPIREATVNYHQNIFSGTRKNMIGSKWVYFKIYCGVVTADKILSQTLYPLIRDLTRGGYISRFFFIRYHDPEAHIRFRFELTKISNLQVCIHLVNEYLSPLNELGIIEKIQTETYVRELERYHPAMSESENIFMQDSLAIARLLAIPEMNNNLYRLAVGIRLTLDFVDLIHEKMAEKILFCKRVKNMLKKDILTTYGSEPFIKDLFDHSDLELSFLLNASPPGISGILKKRKSGVQRQLIVIQKKQQKLGPIEISNLFISYIHMSINRLFQTDQKLYEYIVYCFAEKKLNQHLHANSKRKNS